jgi:hypothetical protein
MTQISETIIVSSLNHERPGDRQIKRTWLKRWPKFPKIKESKMIGRKPDPEHKGCTLFIVLVAAES